MQKTDQQFDKNHRRPDAASVVPVGANCSEVLRSRKEEIAQLFINEVRKKVPAASDKETSVILDSLPEYLDQITKALSQGARIDEAHEISHICEMHGEQRAGLPGYTLEQVLFEYALLRRIILSLLRPHTMITSEESDVIHEAIQEGMIQAGAQFSQAHARARELLEREKSSLRQAANQYFASLSALLASSPVGIGFLDRDLRYLQINEPLARMNGFSVEKHLGRSVREMLPQDAKFIEPLLTQVLQTGKPILNIEVAAKRHDDPEKEFRVLANYFPVQNSAKENIGVGAVVVDVTELWNAQEALRENQEFQARIFESSEDCYKILDLEGKLLVLTKFSERHLEIDDSGPLIGKSWIRFWDREEDYLAAKEAVQRAARGGKGHFVGHFPTPSGKRKWWDVVITPMRDLNGNPEKLLAVARDVTPLHEAEEALKSAQERIDQALRENFQTLKEMTDTLPVLFWWTDEGGKGNHFNKKYYEYTGLPETDDPNEVESFRPIIHPDDLANNLKIRGEALRLRTTAQFHERFRRWDGEYRWHLVHATPVFYEDGSLKRWYATSIDIHEQKMAELEKTQVAQSLKDQTEKLSTRNVELDRFAAIAAHDLKSPLNSITQFSQLLAQQYHGRLDEEADQYIDFIVNAGQRMRELIDNLLEFSRAGAIDQCQLAPVNVQDILGIVRKNLLAEIQKTGARISANSHLPAVLGNQLQISQLFQNLIANAIKFRKPHQPPVIHVDYSDQEKLWRFSVSDQGIGMDPKHSKKIFEIFNKISGHDNREGSGIGLAVCKRIVEAHGGTIDFQSAPEKGTTFFFTLPKAESVTSTCANIRKSKGSGDNGQYN